MKGKEKTRAELIVELEGVREESARFREQMRALAKAVENMQLGVTITDIEGKILYTNPAEARMHGYAVEELLGRDARLLAPQEYGRRMTQEEMKAIRSWTREAVNIRKDRTVFPVKLMSDLVMDEDGAPVAIITTCEDITDRKKREQELKKYREDLKALVEERTREVSETAERLLGQVAEKKRAARALKESEEKFRSLVEQSLVGIYILQDGRVKYANPKCEDIFGYSREELLSLESVLELIADSDHAVVTENLERRLRGEIDSIHYTVRGKRKDGARLDLEVHGTFTHFEGRPAIIGTLLDITVQKQTEEHLRVSLGRVADEKARSEAIIAAIGDAVSIQDTDFRVLYQNKVHEDLVGDHRGEYCYKAYSRSESVCEGCPVALSFRDGQVHRLEKSNVTENGVLHVDIIASPLRDAKGQIIAGIETVRDNTERKKAEAEREKLIAELQEALANIRTLKGLLPICASCKKIRDDKGYWKQLESYIRDRTDADFSHSICPECKEKLYPGL